MCDWGVFDDNFHVLLVAVMLSLYINVHLCELVLLDENSDTVTTLQMPKVTGFRTMTKADVPLAFRLVAEVFCCFVFSTGGSLLTVAYEWRL